MTNKQDSPFQKRCGRIEKKLFCNGQDCLHHIYINRLKSRERVESILDTELYSQLIIII